MLTPIDLANSISRPALLEQLAEECTECAQSALKLARIKRGENPTASDYGPAYDHLQEEMGDVLNLMTVMLFTELWDGNMVAKTRNEKMMRWSERLENRQHESN